MHTELREGAASDGAAHADFRALFEAAPGLYLVLDPAFRIVAVTDAYVAATMTKREEILDRGIFEVFPDNPDDPDATGVGNLRRSLERVRRLGVPDTMAVQKYDIRRPPEEGGGFEVRYWSPRNSPVLDNRRRLRFIIHQVEDVTQFVRLKELESEQQAVTDELREQTARMETEILRRSAELQRANEELRAANAAKNEFLSRMSHELRTPLTAIGGFSELLTLSELGSDERQWASTIHKASRHLTSLVDDVLDLSRIESGNISVSLEPVPLRPLIDDVLELAEPLAERRQVRLHVPVFGAGPGYAFADHQRLKQVVINLVVNAIKYNRENGEVQIVAESDGVGGIRIKVHDTGHGIEPDSLDKLFVPFERLGAATSGIEGTGLGLALSRRLIDAMGGTISVDSVVGVGTTFSVDLPSGEQAALERADVEDESLLAVREYGEERRLLYIEDTVANVRLIEAMLRRRPSVRLIPAMLGRLGLELAREHHPDMILLDLHLPDVGGEEVLAQLRGDETTEDIPVVILSADATMRQRDPLLAAGARGYLTKPIAVADFLELVDRFMASD
jgi:signal transduction histidine kinase/ActR/RegA family two-component response regulator